MMDQKIENQLEEKYVINQIHKISNNDAILKIGQNIKYDIRILINTEFFLNQ